MSSLFAGLNARPMPFELAIEITPDLRELIERPINGEGGFQTLMRGLRHGLRHDHIRKVSILVMSEATMGRVFRYSTMSQGDGGFEGRLEPLAKAIRGARERLLEIEESAGESDHR